jgi:hypothetical protein
MPLPVRVRDRGRDDREQVQQAEDDSNRRRGIPDRGGDAEPEQPDQA